MPEVPRERLQPPSPTTPVPTAAAALSPAPATTFTEAGRPSCAAVSGLSVPIGSKLSNRRGIWLSRMPQISSISCDQRLFFTSSSSMPEASEKSQLWTPVRR